MSSTSSYTFKTSLLDRMLIPLVFVCALVIYLATTSSGAYVGGPANLIATYGGLKPRFSPAYPLWTILTSFLSWLPFGGLALKMNVMSAVIGALTLSVGYDLFSEAIYRVLDVDEGNRRKSVIAARLAGLGMVVALGLSLQFWAVSTRPAIHMFGLLWLTLSARVYLSYCKRGSAVKLASFGLMCGMGLAESSIFFLFVPIFLLHMGYGMALLQSIRMKPFVVFLVALGAGCLMYFIAAWMFYGTEGFVLRDFIYYRRILKHLLTGQVWELKALLNKGWIINLFIGVVPWVAVVLMSNRALNGQRDWSFYILHSVLTVVAILGFVIIPFAIDRISPDWRGWLILGPFMPYVLLSMVFGYLLAYWYLLPSIFLNSDSDEQSHRSVHVVGLVISVALMLLPAAAAFKNVERTNARKADFVNEFAGHILDSMEGREYLVTAGMLDDHLLIIANDRGHQLFPLDLRKSTNKVYQKQLKRVFSSPREQNMLDVGLLPMLQRWLESDPDVGDKVAVLRTPDLLMGAGMNIIPNGVVFLGASDLEEVRVELDLDANLELWNELSGTIKNGMDDGAHLSSYRRFFLQHVGFVANNFAVLLEDLDRPDDAFALYSRIREIDENNISALLNRVVMIDEGGYETDLAEEVHKEFEELKADTTRLRNIWALSRVFGYVRNPELFIQAGLAWVRSANGSMVNSIRRARDMADSSDKNRYLRLEASVFLQQQQEHKSEEIYAEILQTDPKDFEALIQSARLSIRRGDLKRAEELLVRAEEAGVPKPVIGLERSTLFLASGEPDKARSTLEELVEYEPENLRAWGALADVAVQQDDLIRLEEIIAELEVRSGPRSYMVQMSRAALAMKRAQWRDARLAFDGALEAKPTSLPLLEKALKMDVAMRDWDNARRRAHTILKLNPDNSLAHFYVGTQYLREDRLKQAEVSLRDSVRSRPTPDALNNRP